MIRESYELLIENPNSSREKKALYSSDDLADNTFMGIINKYRDYRFEEHIESLRAEFNCPSHSHISFYLEYKVNDFCQHINLFCATMGIYNREEIEYLVNFGEDVAEIREPIVDDLLKNKYAKNHVKAIVCTKFYINRSLDLEDQYETEELEEEEPAAFSLPVETPFTTDKCCICLTEKPDIILVPCLHKSVCLQCEEKGKLTTCPTCRLMIIRKIKI